MGEADLQAQIQKARQELWGGRLKASEGAMQQPHRLRMLRRQIARLHTVLREGQHQARQSPSAGS